MRKVVVQYDNVVRTFDNVSKVQCFCRGDVTEWHLDICQGRKVTTLKMCEFNGFEVKDVPDSCEIIGVLGSADHPVFTHHASSTKELEE